MNTPRLAARATLALVAVMLPAACSDDSGSSRTDDVQRGDAGTGNPDAEAPGPGPDATSGDGAADASHDAFNGDCSTARWANVSDACWSCLCGACKDQLDLCNEDCTDIFACTFEKGTLVNKPAELGCEIRATLKTCIADPKSQAVATPLLDFDTCLINQHTAPNFRACDVECAIPYPGDVCQRFPAM